MGTYTVKPVKLKAARQLRADGWTFQEIAGALGVSYVTLWRHLGRDKARLDARDRSRACAAALDALLDPEGIFS